MKFEAKHMVAIVGSICAAAVLAPVGVLAATSQMGIVDVVNGRRVKVGSSNTLYTESRAGVVDHSFSTLTQHITDVVRHPVYEIADRRIAITEMTFTVRGDNASSTNHISVYSRTRTSGTANCQNGTGWSTPKILRTVSVHAGDTIQLLFNGPAITTTLPAPGQKTCIGFQQTKWTGSTDTDVAMTAYTFS